MAKRILILFFLAGVLIAPEDLSSCGPFLPETIFTSARGPIDYAAYLSGKLGILQPHYQRIYLMAAYRYLTGAGLSADDQKAIMAPSTGPDFWNDQESQAIQAWLSIRTMLGAPPLERIARFKFYGQATYFLNCGDDAFDNAAKTLSEHMQAGVSHDDLRAWVAAQDQVFSNCSTQPPWQPPRKPALAFIPAPLPEAAPAWMKADRAYQIAAAEFYAGEFDKACDDFRRVAADRSSPWHGIAPYLAARALIRKATLVDASAAPAAQEQLRKVLADPDAAPWHESARGLIRYLRAQTDPRGALDEVAHTVASEKTSVAGAMNDYRLLFDRFENHQQNLPRDEDITDWIATMQYDSAGHGLAKWRATHSLPWLVAALTWANRPEADMMAAAAQLGESSPAYLTVEFHRLRLMPAREARPLLDAMLRRKMTVSARNLFLAERMRIARNWDEWLRYAPRTAAGTSVTGDVQPAKAPLSYFDEDAARILNRQAPLSDLLKAAQDPDLPRNQQEEVARAVWVRAIMLGETKTARTVSPMLAVLAPPLKPYLDRYLAARDEKARALEAAWLMMNNPGMRPSIDPGAGRVTPLPKLDMFRDNWWCVQASAARQPLNAPLMLLYQGAEPEPTFLSAAERSEAASQQEGLRLAPAAATWMAKEAVEWVTAHSDNPRAPEALHLAVRAGHYACGGDSQTDRWTERAFRLLHARYPNSDAAKRTQYWYKSGGRF